MLEGVDEDDRLGLHLDPHAEEPTSSSGGLLMNGTNDRTLYSVCAGVNPAHCPTVSHILKRWEDVLYPLTERFLVCERKAALTCIG